MHLLFKGHGSQVLLDRNFILLFKCTGTQIWIYLAELLVLKVGTGLTNHVHKVVINRVLAVVNRCRLHLVGLRHLQPLLFFKGARQFVRQICL